MANAPVPLSKNFVKAIVITAALGFVYVTVLEKLGRDWWYDENYSHGLLVPFVIGIIVWREWENLRNALTAPARLTGAILAGVAVMLLLVGTLAAELFTQRISLVVMLAGLTIYFFGIRLLRLLAVPFALLLLSIPIPQIVFNRIAMPLQIWASQMAAWGIRLFEVPTVRSGNVIDILPRGSTQPISLEVVAACSGIRSLITLMALALLMAYATRSDDRPRLSTFAKPDLARAVLLVLAAIPVAVITNAARVTATGIMTYWWGRQAAEGTTHELSGWLVYVVALALVIGLNLLFRKLLPKSGGGDSYFESALPVSHSASWTTVAPIAAMLLFSGLVVNYFATRTELPPPRQPLSQLSSRFGDWRQKGGEVRFDEAVTSLLGASDYTMREYVGPDGRMANIYVGYYSSQRTGATYHSPQNCLPGSGWILKDPQQIEVAAPGGRTFHANLYTIENGVYRQVMIYWYQGRGRAESSEYRDKLNTVFDSVTRSRTDGAMIRIMLDSGTDVTAAIKAATELAARLEEQLTPFVPE